MKAQGVHILSTADIFSDALVIGIHIYGFLSSIIKIFMVQ